MKYILTILTCLAIYAGLAITDSDRQAFRICTKTHSAGTCNYALRTTFKEEE